MTTLNDITTTIESWGTSGRLKPATAGNLRAACDRVLSVISKDGNIDIENIDIEDAITRFANLNRNLKPDSLTVYKSRVTKALEMFAEYEANPVSWRPSNLKTRKSRAGAETRVNREKSTAASSGVPKNSGDAPGGPQNVPPNALQYPLRSDVTLTISGLPRDITMFEVKRITQFLTSLATDFA